MLSGGLADQVTPSAGVKFSHVNVSSWGNRFVLHQIRAKYLWRRLYTIKNESYTTEKVTERVVSE